MMQKNRLFKILYHLITKGSVTAPELAEKLEVSVRTIYRDIDTLSDAGIPVYTEAGRNGGIRLLDGFVLDKVLLSDSEKQDILNAIQSLTIANSSQAGDTLQKLSALFHLPAQDWYELDFSRWGADSQDNEKFEALKDAVIHHTVTRITYYNSSAGQDERDIWPLKLYYKSREWYLKAFCTKRQDFRLFKLNRIFRYELLGETFLPVSFPEDTTSEAEIPTITVRLRFPKEAAYRVYDEFDASQITRLENGDFIVCSHLPDTPWIISYLLSFGAQAEVLEPYSLKVKIAQQAQMILEKNLEKNISENTKSSKT